METIVDIITSIPPKAVPLIAVLFAYLLADELDPDKKEILASFLFVMASIINSLAINEGFARNFLEGQTQTLQQMRQELDELKKQLHN